MMMLDRYKITNDSLTAHCTLVGPTGALDALGRSRFLAPRAQLLDPVTPISPSSTIARRCWIEGWIRGLATVRVEEKGYQGLLLLPFAACHGQWPDLLQRVRGQQAKPTATVEGTLGSAASDSEALESGQARACLAVGFCLVSLLPHFSFIYCSLVCNSCDISM